MADEDRVKQLERCVCASRFFFSAAADQGSHQTYQILTRVTAQPIRITAGHTWYWWHSLCWDGTQWEIHSVIWTLTDKKKTHRESKNINQRVEKQIFFFVFNYSTVQLPFSRDRSRRSLPSQIGAVAQGGHAVNNVFGPLQIWQIEGRCGGGGSKLTCLIREEFHLRCHF